MFRTNTKDPFPGHLVDDPLASFADDQGIPLGKRFYNSYYNCDMVFVKQLGATALVASKLAVVLTTDAGSSSNSTPGVRLAAATASLQGAAGIRLVGAAPLAQNAYGWVVAEGPTSVIADGTITAEDPLVSSENAAGSLKTMPNTGVGAAAVCGRATATTTTGLVGTILFKSQVY